MRGEYQGKWYAEIIESKRFLGAETISIHRFDTQKERDEFICEQNSWLLDFESTPATYRMAKDASIYNIYDHITNEKNRNELEHDK